MWAAWNERLCNMLVLGATLYVCTGGSAINPNVVQDSIHQTICVNGWTKTVRPPASVMRDMKLELMAKAGLPASDAYQYELDHVVPLVLGGAPLDPANLQLQPWRGPCGAKAKDRVETELARRVCAGDVSLDKAQGLISNDWPKAYQTYVDARGCQ
jgi:hypothetical protein